MIIKGYTLYLKEDLLSDIFSLSNNSLGISLRRWRQWSLGQLLHLLLLKDILQVWIRIKIGSIPFGDLFFYNLFFPLVKKILGRFSASVFFDMRPTNSATVLDRELFINTIYKEQQFSVAGLRLGPFLDNSKNCSSSNGDCGCNQGMRQVYVTAVDDDYSFFMVPSAYATFSFTTCGSSSSDIAAPIVFGQSAPLTGKFPILIFLAISLLDYNYVFQAQRRIWVKAWDWDFLLPLPKSIKLEAIR